MLPVPSKGGRPPLRSPPAASRVRGCRRARSTRDRDGRRRVDAAHRAGRARAARGRGRARRRFAGLVAAGPRRCQPAPLDHGDLRGDGGVADGPPGGAARRQRAGRRPQRQRRPGHGLRRRRPRGRGLALSRRPGPAGAAPGVRAGRGRRDPGRAPGAAAAARARPAATGDDQLPAPAAGGAQGRASPPRPVRGPSSSRCCGSPRSARPWTGIGSCWPPASRCRWCWPRPPTAAWCCRRCRAGPWRTRSSTRRCPAPPRT